MTSVKKKKMSALLSFVIYIHHQSEGFTLHVKRMLTELIGLTLDIPINSSREKLR